MGEPSTAGAPEPTPHHKMLSGRSATEQAEELLEKWERQARLLVAVVRQQVSSTIAGTETTHAQGNEQKDASAAKPKESAPAPATKETQPSPQPAPERAEAILDEWGQRIGRSASLAGQQLRKAAARAREEAEDILAEAQHIRQSDGRKSNSA